MLLCAVTPPPCECSFVLALHSFLTVLSTNSPDPWALNLPPPSAMQQHLMVMERVAIANARTGPLSSLPSGFGSKRKEGNESCGAAYQKLVIRCAACGVDRFLLLIFLLLLASPRPAQHVYCGYHQCLTARCRQLG